MASVINLVPTSFFDIRQYKVTLLPKLYNKNPYVIQDSQIFYIHHPLTEHIGEKKKTRGQYPEKKCQFNRLI